MSSLQSFAEAFKEFGFLGFYLTKSDIDIKRRRLPTSFPWMDPMSVAALPCASVEALAVDFDQEAAASTRFLCYGFMAAFKEFDFLFLLEYVTSTSGIHISAQDEAYTYHTAGGMEYHSFRLSKLVYTRHYSMLSSLNNDIQSCFN